jgi:hypothetical protein
VGAGTARRRSVDEPGTPRRSLARRRARYLALAVATVAVGLAVHRRGDALPAAARDVLGDALWAGMIAWGVGAAAPGAALAGRAAVAYAVCATVELSQLVHHPALDASRRTALGRLALGSDFDPRDLAAYALGVAAACGAEWWITRRGPPARRA